VRHQNLVGLDLENRASAATDLPDTFMKVCGFNSQTFWPFTLVRATRPW